MFSFSCGVEMTKFIWKTRNYLLNGYQTFSIINQTDLGNDDKTLKNHFNLA